MSMDLTALHTRMALAILAAMLTLSGTVGRLARAADPKPINSNERRAGAADSVADGDWPQWRGPDRTGVSRETGLLHAWPEGGPPKVWTASGAGVGYSTVSVADGRLFTMGNRDDREFVICYDVATGKEAWAHDNGDAYRNGRGDGPRGTPTVEGRWVYALGASGDLSCRDVKTGKVKWHLNVLRDLGGRQIGWGLSESVLIVGDRVICTPGGPGTGVVALNKSTGRVIWRSGDDRPGYSSAIAADVGSIGQIIVFMADSGRGLAASDGRELWRYDRAANGTANVATPIFHDDHVFFSSAYGTGAGLVKLTPSGSTMRADEVYFTSRMQNHHCTSVLVGDHLYGFGGRALVCMEFKTGKEAWRDRGVGKGSLVFADGYLYCLSENGVVGLVEATPTAYRETGRFTIAKAQRPTWAHPVVAGGRLYLRNQDLIHCFDVKAR